MSAERLCVANVTWPSSREEARLIEPLEIVFFYGVLAVLERLKPNPVYGTEFEDRVGNTSDRKLAVLGANSGRAIFSHCCASSSSSRD